MSILDGGSMIDVIPLQMAEQLVIDGVVSKIESEPVPFNVVFGKEGAVSTISNFIRGAGLIDKVFVTADVRVALISDITFTDQFITIVKTADLIIAIARDGSIVFVGRRNRKSSNKSLWQTDLVALLRARSPAAQIDVDSELITSSTSPSQAIAIATRALADTVSNGRSTIFSAFGAGKNLDGGGGGESILKSGGVATACFSARPTFAISDVREGRRVQKCFGGLNALANTIDAKAISGVPNSITGALFRRIAEQHDNIPWEMSHRRRICHGGSGVHTIVPGEEFSFDELGIYPASTFGAHSAILVCDRATNVCTPMGRTLGVLLSTCSLLIADLFRVLVFEFDVLDAIALPCPRRQLSRMLARSLISK